jgi:hypothetical protein
MQGKRPKNQSLRTCFKSRQIEDKKSPNRMQKLNKVEKVEGV